MTELRRSFVEGETGVDLRALGLLRAVFGVLLLGYLVTRLWDGNFVAFYTDLGVLPASEAVRRTPGYQGFSLFNALQTPLQAGIGMAVLAAVFALFTVGFRTKEVTFLTLVGLVSLHNRNALTTNASMVFMHVLLAWMLFLPISERVSIDAYRRGGLARALGPGRDRALAFAGFRYHLAAIYALNFIHKSGETWMDGTAVHYILWQHRYNTDFAYFLRDTEPTWLSPLLSYGTLVTEAILPLLLISPFFRHGCRRVAALAMCALHVGIAFIVHLGPFPFVLPLLAGVVLAGEDASRVFDKWQRRFGVEPPPEAPTDEPRPRHARKLRWAREAGAVFLVVLFAWELRDDNKVFKKHLGPSSIPRALAAVTELFYLPQGWQLYTPDTPRVDYIVVVDAERMDGSHVDPRTGKPPDFDVLDGEPPHQNYLWQTYDLYLVTENPQPLWALFIRYLERIPELEDWPGDPRFRQINAWVLKRRLGAVGEPHGKIIKVFAAERTRKYDDEPGEKPSD